MADKSDGASSSMRRVLTVAAMLALVMAVVVPGGLADAVGSDGRDAGATPGAVKASLSSAPAASEDGRASAGAVPSSSLHSVVPSAASESAVDNGRGGVDPVAGPNPTAVTNVSSAVTTEVAEVDTDSGLPPAPGSVVFGTLASVEEGPSDQDVPGAATAGTPGDDAPADDSDG